MSSLIRFSRRPRTNVRTGALDRLTSAFALTHDAHESPLVGCYFCLHGARPRMRALASAA
jgi:hypothetical protein